MTTPSKDISKYDLTDENSAISPAYAGGLFDAKLAAAQIAAAGQIDWDTFTEYKTPGTYSVTVPENCDRAIVFVACGGGAGSSGFKTNRYLFGMSWSVLPGRAGVPGYPIFNKLVSVTPSSTISVVVGGAGVTSTVDMQVGTSGGATKFGTLLQVAGGAAADLNNTQILFFESAKANETYYFSSQYEVAPLYNEGYGRAGWYGMVSKSASGSPVRITASYAITQPTGGYISFAFIRKDAQ